MANLLNLLDYMQADVIRQRSNADRLRHMNRMAAYGVLAPASTVAHGSTLNEAKGATPFFAANASRGMGTARTPASPLGGISVYTATPAPAAPRRRRGRTRR